MGGFLRQLLAPGTKAPGWFSALMVVVLGVTAWWYVQAATRHGDLVNARIDKELQLERKVKFKDDKLAMQDAKRPVHAYDLNDQRVYMNYAMGMRESSFGIFVTRMRMPMFMWLLALEADGTPRQGLDYEALERGYVAFYPDARAFNIQLSLVLLVAMFFALRPWLGNWLGIAFTLMAAFQLFILKSPYVQPEVLQTAIMTVTVAWIVRTLADPKWWNALITGLLLCCWHMTKANALVAVGLMGVIMGVKLLFAKKGERLPILIAGPIVLAGYILPMSPYLYNSWKTFGEPFYNVQSKFYMWGSDVDDKHDLQGTGLDRNFDTVDLDHDGKIDHPEKLPSAGKYWREHSWKEIKERLRKGVDGMFDNAFEEYTPLLWLQMVWAGILVWAASRRWQDTVDAVKRWKWEMLYVAILLTVFVYFFGWFTRLNVGPRLLNSISLLPIFFCMAGDRWLLRRDTVMVRGLALSTEKVLALCFIATWFALTACVLPSDLENGFFAG
jgi:hypothetical protein